MDFLQNHVEALIFCSPGPLKIKEIGTALNEMFDSEIPESDIKKAIGAIKEKFADKAFSFEIVHSGGGYQFLTKPEYQAIISILLK